MKNRKMVSILLAGTMALTAMPMAVLSASAAEGTDVKGDVDMDGYVTAHDAAVISYGLSNGSTLPENADVNGDGVVDAADAQWIHENQTIAFGGNAARFTETGSVTAVDAAAQLYVSAMEGAGGLTIVDGGSWSDNEAYSHLNDSITETKTISRLDYNLLDVNGDGVVDSHDAVDTLHISAALGAGCFTMDEYYTATQAYNLSATESVALIRSKSDASWSKDPNYNLYD